MPIKAFAFSDTKKQTIGKADNLKSPAARQAWKRDINSIGLGVSFIDGRL